MTEQVVPSFPEGIDGTTPVYLERVWPALGMWAFLLLMTASLGIAYAQPFGALAGWITFLTTSAGIVIGLIVNAPIIRVDEKVLRVGRARLPLQYVGQIRILGESDSKNAKANTAHVQAHLNLRSGVKTSVMVEVTDTTDPHPYWHFSTRRPNELLLALTSESKVGN